jgi:abortive infection bacteriophage resistance protein
MAVGDVERAEHWLRHVSYYRLSAYWLPFERPKGQAGPRFVAGTDFDTIIALYEFDRRLRLLVLDAIERIEVAIRDSWAYVLAHEGGPHSYLDASLYSERRMFHDNLSRLARDVGTSPETYIEHYRRNYDDPAMPPVWMVAEMISFGQLSRWYSSLAERALRNRIAQPFGLSEAVLVPLLKHLSIVRNTAAHHGRLWNRGFLIRMKLPLKPEDLAATLQPPESPGPAQLHNTLVLILYLLMRVDPTSTWQAELKCLLAAHPTGDLPAMGFPAEWDRRPLWA